MIIASLFLFASVAAAELPADKLVEITRKSIPSEIEVSGRIIVRSKRGIIKSEHNYELRRSSGAISFVAIDGKKLSEPRDVSKPIIEHSALTWSDLALDYLQWDDVSYDKERESESVHGQKCRVVNLKKGERTVRVWIDAKTGVMMQAEERMGEVVRRLWGTRLKKFGERYSVSVMEVESVGSGLRTKITVERLK